MILRIDHFFNYNCSFSKGIATLIKRDSGEKGCCMRGLISSIISLCKLLVILAVIIWVPRFFLYAPPEENPYAACLAFEDAKFKLGIENISHDLIDFLKFGNNGKPFKIGLVTHDASINQEGKHTLEVLRMKGLTITVVFQPGIELDGQKAVTSAHRVPIGIRSIRMGSQDTQHNWRDVGPADIEDIDILIFDIQDSGIRPFSFCGILQNLMLLASQFNKKFIVFDRPNPLGFIMEGPVASENDANSYNMLPIPFRHAMTCGEIARYINHHVLKSPIDLQVVPMQGYSRAAGLQTALLVPLSTHLTSANACFAYALTFLLARIEPFFVGVGTSKPFQCIMLPKEFNVTVQQWHELKILLQTRYGIDSAYCSYFKKDNQRYYAGLFFSIAEINSLPIVGATITILEFFKGLGVHWRYTPAFAEHLHSPAFEHLFYFANTRTFKPEVKANVEPYDGVLRSSQNEVGSCCAATRNMGKALKNCMLDTAAFQPLSASLQLQEKEQLARYLYHELELFMQRAKPAFLYRPLPKLERV